MIKNKIDNNKIGIVLMLLSALFLAIGQLQWADVQWMELETVFQSFHTLFQFCIQFIPGFLLYTVAALLMIRAYRYGELSILQPINSTSYIFSLILAVVVLHEKVQMLTLAGIGLITVGVIVIGREEA